ncbi:MAG TPA: hypothetical protein VK142_00485 [Bacillota bacterium]|nr:hypothetical protein [Bacillota bacterium]
MTVISVAFIMRDFYQWGISFTITDLAKTESHPGKEGQALAREDRVMLVFRRC